jgi:hypothetical protein
VSIIEVDESSGRRSSGFAALLVAAALLSIACTGGEAESSIASCTSSRSF